MRVVVTAVVAAILSIAVGAAEPLVTTVPLTVAAGEVSKSKSLAINADSSEADWRFVGEFRTPFVVVNNVNVDAGHVDELQFRVAYQFQGEIRTDRHMMVEVTALDENEQPIDHTWAIESDARIGPHKVPLGSLIGVRSDRNSANVKLPAEVVARASSYKIELRSLDEADLNHLPDRPHKLKLAIHRSSDENTLKFTFGNRWELDPSKHEIAFSLAVHDAKGNLVKKRVRFLPYRADGRYEVCQCLPKEDWNRSNVSIAVYTIQPDNEAFRRRFFIEGKGSTYSGVWTGDGGEIARLPYEDSQYR